MKKISPSTIISIQVIDPNSRFLKVDGRKRVREGFEVSYIYPKLLFAVSMRYTMLEKKED